MSDELRLLPIDNRHPDFNAPGEGVYYGVGRDVDGAALVMSHLPGLWHTVSASGAITAPIGQELFPKARYFTSGDMVVSQRSGSLLGYAAMPEEFARVIASSARPHEFYYVSSDPYSRVVRALVSEGKN